MASGSSHKTRWARAAALGLAPGKPGRLWQQLRERTVLARAGLVLAGAVVVGLVLRVWEAPFAFRAGDVPARDVVARVAFSLVDPVATEVKREHARSQVRQVYVLDARPLVQLREELAQQLWAVLKAPSYLELNRQLWAEFQPPAERANPPSGTLWRQRYDRLVVALHRDPNLEATAKAVAEALAPWEQRGLLEPPPEKAWLGNPEEIVVYPAGRPHARQVVALSEVLLGDGSRLRQRLRQSLGAPEVADRVYDWLRPQLVSTLTCDQQETQKALQAATAAVGDVVRRYRVGQRLAEAGRPITARDLQVLRAEHQAYLGQRSWLQVIGRGAAAWALILGCFGLCGLYLHWRQPQMLADGKRLAVLIVLGVATIVLGRWASADAWRAEIIPVLVFGQVMAIAYHQELALLLAGMATILLALGLGQGWMDMMVLMGTATTAVLQLNTIRSRIKLIHVAGVASGVAVVLRLVAAVLDGEALDGALLVQAVWLGIWTLGAGFLITGLLPFVERLFGVLTDMSLLELGDASHPLLQELVRRAPSTYNHSINVGAIAEAAAEAIGARGLLVRVGAYFHDIGKMLKPAYFIENQGPDNLHQSLVPHMSTLVIVAHVKDGADLARQHNLPQPIIDFIQQHHGTTLVEYFYDRASQQSQDDPNGSEVDESTFRYPGPRPQTKEAAVLMLADAVESACRSLVDPTPARIASLVREVAERKLDDGQFDESNLTLRELRAIEDSMTKSLIATYHSRIKYPEQSTV